jgi:TonB-dependent receptor-like protein
MSSQPGKNILLFLRPLNKTIRLISILFIFSALPLAAQDVRVDADNEPLNLVLMKLAREQSIQLSFDDALLSRHRISLHQNFQNGQEAIDFLLSDLPFTCSREGKVLIIFPAVEPPQPPEPLVYRLMGCVVDLLSREPLPYSHLLINGHGLVADQGGNFSWSTSADSLFTLKSSYLGYFILDTILMPGSRHTVELMPSYIGLGEVLIEGQQVERSSQVGEEAGQIRLNHKIAYRLPGNGDNAVFNFLRLQPGILAAGEQSSEMIIWGSYSGHSQLIFDGFTVFGLKNFNDNISFVNPYMSKDIKVMKGGYGADYGDRVGGIVEITGVQGNILKPSINLNINNMTVNGMASIPMRKRASLTFAYRHTYYNLADSDDIGINIRGQNGPQQADISVFPDYQFRDFNIKYAGSTESGDRYFLSLYDGRDNYSYEIDQERNQVRVNQDAQEENRQLGASLYYGKVWENGNTSQLNISASGLNNQQYEKLEISRNQDGSIISEDEVEFSNSILETSLKNKNTFFITDQHKVVGGINYTHNYLLFQADSASDFSSYSESNAHRITAYVQDELRILPGLSITPGIRVDYPINLGQVYVQPRIKASADLNSGWRINAAWGLYRQFISETSLIDDLGNYRYFWALCDNDDVPVLKSTHLVGGISFRQEGLTIGLEAFYKTTTGLSRYISNPRQNLSDSFQGEARVLGTDLLLKKYFGKHEMWVSYTLSKTEEYFSYFPRDNYRYAPQDQRHEVKAAMLMNFHPFYFSANYVYGSGFPDRAPLPQEAFERHPYSRLDASLIYRYSINGYHFEAGISILNLLNTENIKYSNLIKVPDAQSASLSIHAEAVPFTPTIYLNFSF